VQSYEIFGKDEMYETIKIIHNKIVMNAAIQYQMKLIWKAGSTCELKIPKDITTLGATVFTKMIFA